MNWAQRLARGETDNISGEGIHTLRMIEQHSLFEWRKYPLFCLIRQLVSEPHSAEDDILAFAVRKFH